MTFTIEEMQQRFRKFGTIYSGDDIREDVEDIIGLEDKKEMMADFFLSLKKYGDIAANLKAAKIAPNFTMLLYGPPGNGRSTLARAIATAIKARFLYVNSSDFTGLTLIFKLESSKIWTANSYQLQVPEFVM